MYTSGPECMGHLNARNQMKLPNIGIDVKKLCKRLIQM